MKTKAFLIALFILSVFQMSAQTADEVTLVVSADGATKEEATKAALRSAIEQAYGTFVSANTTILDDELVKDEIVTITNGNIKSYEEIANATLPNGNQTVTVKATVCISKLVNYAQSKGASTEFAGATFGMNMKMKELNKRNELAALRNLTTLIKEMMPTVYVPQLTIEPKAGENGDYKLEVCIDFLENENTKPFMDMVLGTMKSISLSRDEVAEYGKVGLRTRRLMVWNTQGDMMGHEEGIFMFRNNDDSLKQWCQEMELTIADCLMNYEISDNTGQTSSLNVVIDNDFMKNWMIHTDSRWPLQGTGIFAYGKNVLDIKYTLLGKLLDKYKRDFDDHYLHDLFLPGYPQHKQNSPKTDFYRLKIVSEIPATEISKYTNFTIKRRM